VSRGPFTGSAGDANAMMREQMRLEMLAAFRNQVALQVMALATAKADDDEPVKRLAARAVQAADALIEALFPEEA
jgi:hypothetical protein